VEVKKSKKKCGSENCMRMKSKENPRGSFTFAPIKLLPEISNVHREKAERSVGLSIVFQSSGSLA
jgi:hypothetical protein